MVGGKGGVIYLYLLSHVILMGRRTGGGGLDTSARESLAFTVENHDAVVVGDVAFYETLCRGI